ncbi:MAG: phospholipase A [Rhodocyclaceae bacterium]|nr:phospholipase A [Rhodocyclaceae bacterium]
MTERTFVHPGAGRAVGLAFLLELLVAPARAAGWLVAAPDPQVVPGQRFEVVLIGPGDDAGQWPQRLPARIELPGSATQIALELVAIGPPGAGSGQRRYFAQWPGEILGVVSLVLPEQSGARLLLEARAVAPSPGGSGQEVADAATDPGGQAVAERMPGVEAIAPKAVLPAGSDPVAPTAISFHEPMYFLVGGRDPVSARFQFSFKYRIFDDHGVVAENVPIVRGLYFGFTQTSLWDLESNSKPFRDSSFRPTLFYSWRLSDPGDRGWLGLSLGYEHESNGKEDTPSRSIDTLFVRAEGRYVLPDGRTWIGIAPKLWTYLDREDNPDIARYRGYGELGLRIGRDDGLMLSSLIRRGTSGKTGVQLDLSYPLRTSVFSGVGTFVHLQAFRGYGETLLEYDLERRTQVRVGVSLVR